MKARLLENCLLEAGVDEAGRGCLAGPVVAAAVILPENFSHPDIRDSKMLSATQRKKTVRIIQEHAICWGIGIATPREIEAKNIVQATMLAMHRAIVQLKIVPEHILVDGNYFIPYQSVAHKTIVKGDATFMSIAAASILAKQHRDEILADLDTAFPIYGWKQNKGYPTKQYREAIRSFGACIHHRKTFQLLPRSQEGSLFDQIE